jgi:hypothetical protein
MKVGEIAEILNAEILVGKDKEEFEINIAGASDMISDVLLIAQAGMMILTGLNSPQIIRSASMLDVKAVVVVRGKIPLPQMIKMAEQYGVILMKTDFGMYKSCGLLYSNGLRGLEG